MKSEQREKIMTGVIIVLGILVFLGVVYVISEHTGDRSNDKTTSVQEEGNPLLVDGEVLKEEEQKELRTMTMEDLENALSNNEKRIVMLGSESCYWCLQQKPILMSVAYQYDMDIDYLNVQTLTADNYSRLAELDSQLASFGTPTFIIVNEGKVVEVSVGATGTNGVIELLKNHNFID